MPFSSGHWKPEEKQPLAVTDMLREFVKGIPKPQPRVKAFSRGGKAGVYTPDSHPLREWRYSIISELQRHKDKNLDGAIEVALEFYLPRPKSHYRTGKYAHMLKNDAPRYVVKKPDVDNLAKLVMDELSNMRYWKDDSQVVALKVTKDYDDVLDAGCRITTRVL